MKILVPILAALVLLGGCVSKHKKSRTEHNSFCNPLNLNYRFCLDDPSRREAADPTVIQFKETFYLFASKSGGYWYSDNLSNWTFVETNQIPVEDYAPTAVVIGDTVYFMASSHSKNSIYKSGNPKSGQWQIAVDSIETPVWDPAFFMDTDNRLYLYWGCSNNKPLYGVELDAKNNFAFLGAAKELIYPNTAENGWEVPGDYNTLKNNAPWLEGQWMTKHNNTYYLQYSGPGTEFKSYSDAVYTSKNPLGPFTCAALNPFSYKPEGFAAGAGHGSTFTDSYGNYWHIATSTISVKQMFERRLVLFPVFFNTDGSMYAATQMGDYPMQIPDKKINSFDDIFQNLMLLSYQKNVTVSSETDSFPAKNLTDEDIRTYWAAVNGDNTQFASIDLGLNYDVQALQINFAEHLTKIRGRKPGTAHQYLIEYSNDNKIWKILVDSSQSTSDQPHQYLPLKEKVNCRYIRIKNIAVPDGNFAISDFRIFGKGNGTGPKQPQNFNATRNLQDKRSVKLQWQAVPDATGYLISYGINDNMLYLNYMVYNNTSIEINSLNTNKTYYFKIRAFNENGFSDKSDKSIIAN